MKPIAKRHYKAKVKNVTVSVRIPDTLKKELESLAKEYGRGFSDFIQEGLDQWASLHKTQSK